MPIILALIVLYAPRLLIAYEAFFTHWFDASKLNWAWMIMGFMFAPFTLLWYSAVYGWYGGHWDLMQKIVMVIAVLIDLGGGFGAARRRR